MNKSDKASQKISGFSLKWDLVYMKESYHKLKSNNSKLKETKLLKILKLKLNKKENTYFLKIHGLKDNLLCNIQEALLIKIYTIDTGTDGSK